MPRAIEILLRHWDGRLPVDVGHIAKQLGATVRAAAELQAWSVLS